MAGIDGPLSFTGGMRMTRLLDSVDVLATPAELDLCPMAVVEPCERSPELPSPPRRARPARPLFVNPVCEGADPWVTRHDNLYYFCETEGHDGIAVRRSARLTDKGVKRVVWRPEPGRWNSRDIWAPELHRLFGRWYIYYTATSDKNAHHRSGVLRALTDDPQGPYEDCGMLYTGDDIEGGSGNRWSIDATPLLVGDRLYLLWSGWPDEADIQYLYIAPMANPWTVAGSRVRLCANDTYVWERVNDCPTGRGLHEGPQVLQRHGRVFIIYSCSSSWHPTYKLNMLYMEEHADPLDPRSWVKSARPVLAPTRDVFGVGHASFTTSPDGTEDWVLFHAKRTRRPGWERAVWMQPFGWTADGFPDLGSPIPAGTALPVPSGEETNQPGEAFCDTFGDDTWDRWTYYGHNRYIWVSEGRLNLGGLPGPGAVNLYRAGEKALVRGADWSDFSMRVRLRILSGRREAGVVFRVTHPGVGYHAQRGYFASFAGDRLVLGRTDGTRARRIASAACPTVEGQWYTLRVDAVGENVRVYVNDELRISARAGDERAGMAGVRVVDTHAEFDTFEIEPL